MRKTMALGLIMLATVACDNRQSARQETGGAQQASPPPVATGDQASLAAGVPAHHKIPVKLKKQDSECVVEEPVITATVKRCDYVRWQYKNQCAQGKKKPKIDRKYAPISGDCLDETEIENGEDKEGKECRVDNNATPGKHKYGIHGNGVVPLDPELEIPQPPPPQHTAATPTPCP